MIWTIAVSGLVLLYAALFAFWLWVEITDNRTPEEKQIDYDFWMRTYGPW
jgi:hypothetical protein